MKTILVAKFVLEANEHVPMKCCHKNVAISYGQKALSHMQMGDVFDDPDSRVIPVICADAACSGVMTRSCFDFIEQAVLAAVSEHLKELDGIYLHLHGASYVEGIGSGDHHMVAAIRELVGPYFPVAVSCDPHGNLTEAYVHNTTFLRSYRESPHTDIAATVQRTCRTLLDLISRPRSVTPVYRKLPLILGGEQSVSADEPVRSINRYMDDLEKDPRILSASWHVGYLRHDCPEAGCGIVVVPNDAASRAYAEEAADRLASFIWERRHEFHYTGITAAPEEALQMALSCDGKPVFLTDSGDNVTSGAMGANTSLLRQVLALPELSKRFLFAAVNDPAACHFLLTQPIGTTTNITLGMGADAHSAPIPLTVTVRYKGTQEGTHMYGEHGDYGDLVTVSVAGKPIDIAITDNNHSFVEKHQIDACGVAWDDYDVIIVKQGYIHPELKEKGALSIMALTDGATPQNTRLIPFKRIMRPMYPLDDI